MRADDIDEGFVPTPAKGVVAVPVGNEAVLVHESGARLSQLNPSATLVWTCLDGAGTIAEIAGDLADGLEVPPEDMRRDVLELVRDLGREQVLAGIEPDEEPPALAATGPAVTPDLDPDAADPTEADPYADPRFLGEPPSH